MLGEFDKGMFSDSWKWHSEFVIISNIGIMRFEEGQYDNPKSTIKWEKNYKFVVEKKRIDGRSNVISIWKEGKK